MDLQATVATLLEENTKYKQEIAMLKAELAELRRLIFGKKSEKRSTVEDSPLQLNLFGETAAPQQVETKQIKAHTRKVNKKHPGRVEVPEHFPVEERVIEPDVDVSNMIRVGKEVTTYVEHIPGSLRVIKLIRYRYVDKDKEGTFVIADLPSRAIPKSKAGNSLITWILVRKFVEYMPFYRQRQAIKREYQWDIPSSTINAWFISTCTLLKPLYELLVKQVISSGYLMVDESPLPVLDKDKVGSTHKGYQWVYCSPESRLVFYDYRRGRGSTGPKEVLKDYNGLLQSDGYKVYDRIAARNGWTHGACLVHIRRYFIKAEQQDPDRAKHALEVFSRVYSLERQFKTLSPEQRKEHRQQTSLPLLEGLKEWIEKQSVTVLPQSALGVAMNHYQKQWTKIKALFSDGRYELDNNLVENKIRPLVLGRKNYMFAGSHDAAKRIAMMYSFFGSCAANDINPSDWLQDVLDRLPDMKINQLVELLPGYDKA